MPKLNSIEMRTERMVLNWLTPKRWCALSEENKIKIYLKVYEKAVPSKSELQHSGTLNLLQLVKEVKGIA